MGWKVARCSSRGHPRNVHQIVSAIPARPVAPPITPLNTPIAPSAALPRGHRRELWPYQAVKAEKHQNNPDRNPQGRGRGPAQQLDAHRHPDHGAGQKRQQAGRLYRPAQFPDREALHDQSVGHDQRRRLRRRQSIQPHRGGDDAEGKARHPSHERGGECPNGEQNQIEGLEIGHGIPHHDRRALPRR